VDDIDYLPGARVLGRYRGGEFGFPGIVERADPSGVTVQYDDGDRETRPVGDVRPLGWHPGARIDAVWSGNGQWYAATILDISDRRVAVRFDDGIEEETETARCRMPWAGPVAVEPGQRVLGRWRGGDHWFPAVVRGVGDGIVALDYDDGDREEVPADAVRLLDWEVGTRIEAIWSGNGRHYEASIIDIAPDGSSLTVRFDDGIVEETVTARCRQA
jgi:PAS domain-containing protein